MPNSSHILFVFVTRKSYSFYLCLSGLSGFIANLSLLICDDLFPPLSPELIVTSFRQTHADSAGLTCPVKKVLARACLVVHGWRRSSITASSNMEQVGRTP